MYSMVLMAALTTGADMPDFGRHGCRGCWGGCYGGCYGGWGGCYGSWGRGWGGCYGGWGGCYGGMGMGWGGCYGGCYGGWGGGYGGWGGGWAGWGGGWGGWGYAYAPPVFSYAAPTALAYNPIPVATAVTTRSMYPNTSPDNRATITVHLPESATLAVDGKPTTSTSATRHFYSPPLEPGRTYHYTFEARMERDGKTVKAQRSVDVTANDRREITINMPDTNPPPQGRQSAKPDENNRIRERQRVGG
jgi:uncharacterized protein (TIGR03000 family)